MFPNYSSQSNQVRLEHKQINNNWHFLYNTQLKHIFQEFIFYIYQKVCHIIFWSVVIFLVQIVSLRRFYICPYQFTFTLNCSVIIINAFNVRFMVKNRFCLLLLRRSGLDCLHADCLNNIKNKRKIQLIDINNGFYLYKSLICIYSTNIYHIGHI